MSATSKILLTQLLASNAPLTSSVLAERADVSVRTVKREMKAIAAELEEHGAHLVSGNAGYSIEVADRKAFEAYRASQSSDNSRATSDDETTKLIVCALVTNDYVTQDDLADMLFVSRSTVGKVMRNVRGILDKRQIVLSSRPHYGYYLIGQEEAIRNFMVEWLLRSENIDTYSEPMMLDRCRNHPEFLRKARAVLADAGYKATDPRAAGLIKYFIAIGARCAHKQTIDTVSDNTMVDESARELAGKVADIIADSFNVRLGEGERAYLSFLLGNVSTQAGSSGGATMDPSFFEGVVDDCIAEVRESYGRDFSKDETLRRGLVSHLYSTCSRMQINAVLSLPMLSMVKTQYTEAYDYAVLCGRLLLERYGLQSNEDSLGYIAMHFAAAIERQNAVNYYRVVVVCDSGFGTSELLRMRIITRLNDVAVVDVLSAAALATYDLSNIHLVISTVPLDPEPSVPHIVVTPFFDDADSRKVSDYLKYFKDAERVRGYFSPKLFFPRINARTKADALTIVCDKLIEAGVMEEEDRASVFHREEVSSTEINPLVAMPHCVLGEGGRSCYAIFTTTRPIDWKHMDVQVIIPLLISKTTGIDRQMFPMVYRLTQDTEKVKRLAEITDFETFMDELFSNPHFEG